MKQKKRKSILYYVLLFLGVAMLVYFLFGDTKSPSTEINYSTFSQNLVDGKIKEMTLQPADGVYKVQGTLDVKKNDQPKEKDGLKVIGGGKKTKANPQFSTIILPSDSSLDEITKEARQRGTEVKVIEPSDNSMFMSLLISLLPLVLMFGFFYMMMKQQGGGVGGPGGVMNFGKSKAKESDKSASKVRFSDVAGAEEEKQELVEVVEFLKDPKRYNALGARIPAGVLLEGPPGTGKTLLAKAVAGEAGVPFYSISGSDFVEMFVGVGASRVRDLFDTAKKNAPAIIFIDEIDAVGRQRGAGMGGGHDEREQTLNQLLVEMDGFNGSEGVIVIAATNRSDVLDPALLRPGRFDRQILVGRPDVNGREAILKVHARNKPLAPDVDLKVVAQQTPGFSGAELENVLNEAALVAARRNKTVIDASDIDEAEDRVIAGPAKRNRVISEKEREMVAYHEAGHTIIGLVLSDARVVHKVTIVPRGRAGGYMVALPKEDRFLMTKEEMFQQIVGLLGGRTAEEIVFGVQSTGASNDFQQATQMARSMITEYGMSDKLGPVQYEGNSQPFVGRDYGQAKPYSEQTAFEIDQEVANILNAAHEKAREIIEEYRDKHKLIAEKLLEYETLDARSIKSLFETGEMPKDDHAMQFPSENAQSYEETKAALEAKEKEERLEDRTEDHLEEKELYQEEQQDPVFHDVHQDEVAHEKEEEAEKEAQQKEEEVQLSEAERIRRERARHQREQHDRREQEEKEDQ